MPLEGMPIGQYGLIAGGILFYAAVALVFAREIRFYDDERWWERLFWRAYVFVATPWLAYEWFSKWRQMKRDTDAQSKP